MTAAPAERLQKAAERNIALLSQLDAVLVDESSALRQKQMEAIHRVLDSKLSLLHQLEITGREFISLVRKSGIDPKNDSAGNWLGSADLASAATRLRKLLETCEARNRQNGNVIDLSRKFVENLLDILQTGAVPTRTYDRSGRMDAYGGAHARAKI